MDYWFNIKVEQSLLESLHVAQDVYQEKKEEMRKLGEIVARRIENHYDNLRSTMSLNTFLSDIVERHSLTGIEIISPQRTLVTRISSVV